MSMVLPDLFNRQMSWQKILVRQGVTGPMSLSITNCSQHHLIWTEKTRNFCSITWWFFQIFGSCSHKPLTLCSGEVLGVRLPDSCLHKSVFSVNNNNLQPYQCRTFHPGRVSQNDHFIQTISSIHKLIPSLLTYSMTVY